MMCTVGASVRSCRAMPAAICKQIRAQVKLGVEPIGFTAVLCLLGVLWSTESMHCPVFAYTWAGILGTGGMGDLAVASTGNPAEYIFVQLDPI